MDNLLLDNFLFDNLLLLLRFLVDFLNFLDLLFDLLLDLLLDLLFDLLFDLFFDFLLELFLELFLDSDSSSELLREHDPLLDLFLLPLGVINFDNFLDIISGKRSAIDAANLGENSFCININTSFSMSSPILFIVI